MKQASMPNTCLKSFIYQCHSSTSERNVKRNSKIHRSETILGTTQKDHILYVINRSIFLQIFQRFYWQLKKDLHGSNLLPEIPQIQETPMRLSKIQSNCYYARESMLNSFSKPKPDYSLDRMSWRRTIITFLTTFTGTGILWRLVLKG